MIMSILKPNYILSFVFFIITSIMGLFVFCVKSKTHKFTCISMFAAGGGYCLGNLCLHYNLTPSDIIFCSLATVLVFVSVTIAAFTSREMIYFYILSGTFFGFTYLPLCLFYIFTGGQTVFTIILSVVLIMSIITLMVDTQRIINEIEKGCDQPFELAFILFLDLFDLMLQIIRLVIATKRSSSGSSSIRDEEL